MAEITQVKVDFTNLPGGPGVATHYFDTNATPPLGALNTFYQNLRGLWPQAMQEKVRNVGVIIDAALKEPVGNWAGAAQPVNPGITQGAYAAPVGACIEWKTGGFINGHEVKGRTFLVPLLASCYDTDGTLTSTTTTTFATQIATLLAASPKMVVYSKTHGFANVVTSGQVLDKVAVMRSRRP